MNNLVLSAGALFLLPVLAVPVISEVTKSALAHRQSAQAAPMTPVESPSNCLKRQMVSIEANRLDRYHKIMDGLGTVPAFQADRLLPIYLNQLNAVTDQDITMARAYCGT